MCGTLTSILGQAAALMVIEKVLTPSFGVSELRFWMDFLLKGISTYWVYNYAKCSGSGSTASGTTSNPLHGMSAMKVIVGGIFGGIILAVSAMFLPLRAGTIFGGMDFMAYVLEAVILNFSYQMGANVISDFA